MPRGAEAPDEGVRRGALPRGDAGGQGGVALRLRGARGAPICGVFPPPAVVRRRFRRREIGRDYSPSPAPAAPGLLVPTTALRPSARKSSATNCAIHGRRCTMKRNRSADIVC